MNYLVTAYKILKLKQNFSFFLTLSFIFHIIITPVQAQGIVPFNELLNLPVPGAMVTTSEGFQPVLIKGITINPENPLNFDFIVNIGDTKFLGDSLAAESTKIIKYFLAALTIPEEEMWVNLSPFEQDRIIPDNFSRTEMGRDLLAQDYMLKQLTASLIFPENSLGKKFWERVYKKANLEFGSTDIPLNTFNKIWILPDKARVFENQGSAFIINSRLKVMLEEDFLALEHNLQNKELSFGASNKNRAASVNKVTSAIVREILIPEIEHEVNHGKNFANLRQIYNSMIIATWFKRSLQRSLLGQVYVNQNKTNGVDLEDPTINQRIYKQYLEALKKGVYNFIREEKDSVTQQMIPRKYFSGGFGNTLNQDIEIVDASRLSENARNLVQEDLIEDLKKHENFRLGTSFYGTTGKDNAQMSYEEAMDEFINNAEEKGLFEALPRPQGPGGLSADAHFLLQSANESAAQRNYLKYFTALTELRDTLPLGPRRLPVNRRINALKKLAYEHKVALVEKFFFKKPVGPGAFTAQAQALMDEIYDLDSRTPQDLDTIRDLLLELRREINRVRGGRRPNPQRIYSVTKQIKAVEDLILQNEEFAQIYPELAATHSGRPDKAMLVRVKQDAPVKLVSAEIIQTLEQLKEALTMENFSILGDSFVMAQLSKGAEALRNIPQGLQYPSENDLNRIFYRTLTENFRKDFQPILEPLNVLALADSLDNLANQIPIRNTYSERSDMFRRINSLSTTTFALLNGIIRSDVIQVSEGYDTQGNVTTLIDPEQFIDLNDLLELTGQLASHKIEDALSFIVNENNVFALQFRGDEQEATIELFGDGQEGFYFFKDGRAYSSQASFEVGGQDSFFHAKISTTIDTVGNLLLRIQNVGGATNPITFTYQKKSGYSPLIDNPGWQPQDLPGAEDNRQPQLTLIENKPDSALLAGNWTLIINNMPSVYTIRILHQADDAFKIELKAGNQLATIDIKEESLNKLITALDAAYLSAANGDATLFENLFRNAAQSVSATNKSVGGIDLNAALLNLEIKHGKDGHPLPWSQQPVEKLNIEGLYPVIINITPVTNLPMLIGLSDNQKNGHQLTRI